MPERLVFEVSRVRWIMMAAGLGIVGSLTFVVFFLIPGGNLGYAVLFVIFVALPFVLALAMIVRPTSLVLTPAGFSEGNLAGRQAYGWDEIEVLGVLDLGAGEGLGRHVVFKLTDDARRRRGGVLSSMRRLGLKDYDGSVGNEYLISTEELCGMMERWRARARAASPPSVDSPPDERTRAI